MFSTDDQVEANTAIICGRPRLLSRKIGYFLLSKLTKVSDDLSVDLSAKSKIHKEVSKLRLEGCTERIRIKVYDPYSPPSNKAIVTYVYTQGGIGAFDRGIEETGGDKYTSIAYISQTRNYYVFRVDGGWRPQLELPNTVTRGIRGCNFAWLQRADPISNLSTFALIRHQSISATNVDKLSIHRRLNSHIASDGNAGK